MIRLITLLFLITISHPIYSQNVSIPDVNFKNYLLNNSLVNTNNDNEIQISEAIAFTGTLSFQFYSVSDLTGIEAFTNLTILDCGDNNLTSIDLSQNVALEQLYCYDNQLTTLDLSENLALLALDCRDNQISNLDVSSNTLLYYLNCPFNNMNNLNVQNTALTTLRCYSNQLTNLDLSSNALLTTLVCNYNEINELDLNSNSDLTILECNYNALTNLKVANSNYTNVTIFEARNNPNLECIEVDDVAYSTTNWTNIDSGTSFTTDCLLSIKESTELPMLELITNPVNQTLKINSNKDINYSIFSLTGQNIKSGFFSKGNNTLNLSILSEGLYIFKGKSLLGEFISVKFVKK